MFDLASICGPTGCSVFGLLRDYQTLLTGILALVAALIAAAPVKRQLSEMATQTRVVLIDHLEGRVQSLSREIQWWQKHCGQVLQDIADGIPDDDDGSEGSYYNPHRAFDLEQRLSEVIDEANTHIAGMLGNPPPETGALVIALKTISSCLDAIHRPTSTDRTDIEPMPSDEEWAHAQDELEAEAKQANADLLARTADARRGLNSVERSLEAERSRAQARLAALHRATIDN